MNGFKGNRTASTQLRIGGDAQALASCKVRPVFDAESVCQPGFLAFAEAWRNVEPLAWCYIPKFEYDKLAEVERTYVNALVAARRMGILDCGTESDYGPVFDRFAAMKAQAIAMVLGNSANANAVIAANSHYLLNVQPYKLTDMGTLVGYFISNPNETAPRPMTPSSSLKPEETAKQYNGFIVATRPEAIAISVLQHRKDLGIGGTVYNSQGMAILLKSEAMVNADSITYTTNHPGLWAKIYVSKSLTTLTEEKCKRMLSKEIKFEGLCWPTDILRDTDGVFAGILVDEVKGTPLLQCVFNGIDNGIRQYFPGWDKLQLTQLTITILKKIKYIHNMGILFGCLNPASIIVKDENNVYLTDMDHYQIEGFPCMIRNTMFTPPELQDKLRRNKMYLCTLDQEKYAVALLVFMLMMPGKMPYAIEDNSHAPDSIMQQKFAFSYKGEQGSDRTEGSWRFVWSHLTPFKETFFQTFKNGERFNAPERRPSDNRWLTLTNDFKEELERKDLYDPHTRELVPKSFKRFKGAEFIRCRYCNIEHPRFYFRDEYFNDYKICRTCLEEPSDISFTCVDCGRTFTYTNRTAIYHARMKEQDDSWCRQKHCRDCKSKMTKCVGCGKDVPLFRVNHWNGYCFDCNNDQKAREQARRNTIYRTSYCQGCHLSFSITVGEHESMVLKGFSDPKYCEACRKARKRNRY